MKYTLGYSTEVSVPVTISYKCSNCGEENIQVVRVKGDFFGSKSNSEKVATEILQKNLDTLVTSGDLDDLKNIGINTRCAFCGKPTPWSSRDILSSKIVVWGIILLLGVIGFFCYKGFVAMSSTTYTYEQETIIGVSVFAVIALILVFSIFMYFVKNRKKRTIPTEARPKVIRIGDQIIG